MKRITPLFLLLGLLAPSGCISTHLVKHKAQPHSEYDPREQQHREVEGEPGYYALLPLTIAGDVATSPFQIVYFLFTDSSHRGTASIHGVPIPLP
jgi:hypothetical protein